MKKSELWNKIKDAETWLKEHYKTHPRKIEALQRYEKLCDDYHEWYGTRPFQDDFTPQGEFDFNKASERLREKIPRIRESK